VVEECKTDSSRRSSDEVGRHVSLIAKAALRVEMARGFNILEIEVFDSELMPMLWKPGEVLYIISRRHIVPPFWCDGSVHTSLAS
jgi:hypothetical protein